MNSTKQPVTGRCCRILPRGQRCIARTRGQQRLCNAHRWDNMRNSAEMTTAIAHEAERLIKRKKPEEQRTGDETL